jgi:F0F1-type ATP synthase membrane subunit a
LGASVASDEHGLPPQAVDIARPFSLPIANSMVVTWIVALGLIIFAWVATRNMKAVPDGAQNSREWLVGGLYSFSGGSHRAIFGQTNLLVLCDHFHFHSVGELVWLDSWKGKTPAR